MLHGLLSIDPVLLAAQAAGTALLFAAMTDLDRRRVPNALPAVITVAFAFAAFAGAAPTIAPVSAAAAVLAALASLLSLPLLARFGRLFELRGTAGVPD